MTNITGPKGRVIVRKTYGPLGWQVHEDGSVRTSYFGSFKDAIKLDVPMDYVETLIQRLIIKHQKLQERNL